MSASAIFFSMLCFSCLCWSLSIFFSFLQAKVSFGDQLFCFFRNYFAFVPVVYWKSCEICLFFRLTSPVTDFAGNNFVDPDEVLLGDVELRVFFEMFTLNSVSFIRYPCTKLRRTFTRIHLDAAQFLWFYNANSCPSIFNFQGHLACFYTWFSF